MAEPLYVRHGSSVEHDTGLHPEGPGRIPAIEEELARRDWLGYRRVEAPAVDLDVLERVHPRAHVESVRAMSERGGGAFDPDTTASAGSYNAALHAAGGACALADELLSGAATAGFCGLRPPGHHAEPTTAMGFCLFNNVAVAAAAAVARGLSRVAVVDIDVHHGNGTQSMFYADPRVLYVSSHQFPFYPGTGAADEVGTGAGKGFTFNVPLAAGATDADYAAAYRTIAGVLERYAPQLVLVSAGFDAHESDPLASMRMTTAGYAAVVKSLADTARRIGCPMALVTEGGYDLDALRACLDATLAGI